MVTQLTEDQHVPISVRYLTASGQPGEVAATPVWSSSNEAVVTVGITTMNGLHADVRAVAPGTARVTVVARPNADPNAPVIELFEDFHVIPGQVVRGEITVGVPERK